jgi:hypothetical protein
MKIAEYIAFTIDRLPNGYVFTYVDFTTEVNQKEAVIKALNRMVASGKIAKLSKGKYYKPENTPFGNLQPNQAQVVKDLLEENGKITGYLTGYSIYNQLGLTTQVSNTIQIGKNQVFFLILVFLFLIDVNPFYQVCVWQTILTLQYIDFVDLRMCMDASQEKILFVWF